MFQVRPRVRQNLDSPPKSGAMVELTASGENLPPILAATQNWHERWCTMPACFARQYEKIYNFEARDDDVFVVTFPKSGTTWLQEAIWLLLNDLDYETAKAEAQNKRSPFMESSGMNPKVACDTVEACNKLKSPRLIKLHLPVHLLPRQIWKCKNKIVYCARNLKDVVVSLFHFTRGLGYWSGEMYDFVSDFMHNEIMFTPYWSGVLDFWQLRDEPYVYFTTYEQLKADLPAVLRALCEFLERTALTDTELAKLVQHLSFESMKSNAAANPTFQVTKYNNNPCETLPELQFMRRGIFGAYKEELSIQNQKRLDEWSQQFLQERQVKLSDIWSDVDCDI